MIINVQNKARSAPNRSLYSSVICFLLDEAILELFFITGPFARFGRQRRIRFLLGILFAPFFETNKGAGKLAGAVYKSNFESPTWFSHGQCRLRQSLGRADGVVSDGI